MDTNKQKSFAQDLFRNKDYFNAEPIFKELWSSSKEQDKWLGWQYSFTLKSLGKIDEAIEVSKTVYCQDKNFSYNKNHLCWLLYEKYLKKMTHESIYDFNKSIEIAKFIIENTNQLDSKSAYEATVFRVIEILKSRNVRNYKSILFWLSKIDYNLLSDNTFTITLDNGQIREGASRKEVYFAEKTKCLEKIREFSECIIWSDLAKSNLDTFHYNNDIWIDARKYYSKCMMLTMRTEEFKLSVKAIEDLYYKKSHWSISYKLFSCYLNVNDYKCAKSWGAKALLSKDPMHLKIPLIYEMGLLYEKLGELPNAIMHFSLVKSIRDKEKWKIPTDLMEKIKKYNFDVRTESNIKELWISIVQCDKQMQQGTILKLLPDGKKGFIQAAHNKSYYFKKSSIIGGLKHNLINCEVIFRLIDSFDEKKKQNSNEAVDIIIK